MNNTTQSNYFTELSAINVSEHVEKKGQFDYLSWPYAVAQLRMFDESATWVIERFNGLPFLTTDYGTFVEVAVTVRGVTLSQIHPVLDSRNKTIPVPSAFDINTSIQRCLVKAIALHGLGLNVYAGEDLPHSEDTYAHQQPTATNKQTTGSSSLVPVTFGKARAALETQHRDNIKTPEILTDNQLRYLKRLITETGSNEFQLLEYIGYTDLSNLPKFEVNRVIQILEQRRQDVA